ncbi:MAG: T9SS type A sorting domain-containing protein [Vicingaceae bacterium]
MKKISHHLLFLLLVIFVSPFLVEGQSGPAGVGNSSNNILWLQADRLTLSDGDPVSTWTNFSGNSTLVSQSNASLRPTFKESQVNGLPAIEFNGTSNVLDITPNIVSGDMTCFIVINPNTSVNRTVMHTNENLVFRTGNAIGLGSTSPWKFLGRPISVGSFRIFAGQDQAGPAGTIRKVFLGNAFQSDNRNNLYNLGNSALGAANTGSYIQHFNGSISEVILYNVYMSSAERRIVGEYLGAKYDLTSESGLYSYRATHATDLKGIGQESDGSNTSARGNDSLEISNASSLGDGDYMIIGSDGGAYTTSTSVPTNIAERWTRTWRADITGTPGTVDLRFYLGSNNFSSPLDYVILAETDNGDFSDGGTSILATNPSYNFSTNSVTFSGITLTDGMHFTLAEPVDGINSQADGDWDQASTWDCGCIPGELNDVTIQNTHDITIDANASAAALTVEAGASIVFSGSDTLSIYDDATFAGTINSGTGTIALLKSTDAQLISNTNGSIAALFNVYVNNNQGAEIQTGGFSIRNNLQVSSGGLDVSLADSVVLLSNSFGSSQILESMNNAFTGNFKVQRFIGSRASSYANISSPISNGTVAELDDDFYLSGVSGSSDADILLGGSVVWYSMFQFNSATGSHEEVTSTATTLTPARGYEIFINPFARTYQADTTDYIGTPNDGSVSITLNQGFNLVGNPYHSFIDFANLSASGVSSTFYIWNSDNGNYSTFTGSTNIAPGQGFWVNKTTSGSTTLTFNENDKVNSNSNSFLREKKEISALELSIASDLNSYRHEMDIKLSPIARNTIDEQDAFHLPSPIKEAPAIYAKLQGVNQGLVTNAISQWEESHTIPIVVKTSVAGDYRLTAANLESIYDNYNCIFLKDKQNGKQIDLSVEQEYLFTSESGKHNRFDLLISNSFEDCMKPDDESAYSQAIESELNLRNAYGEWYLDYTFDNDETRQVEIKVLNMNGQEVIAPQSIGLNGAGSFELNGLENLDGIYLIQIRTAEKFINQTIKL